jgi:hypothetical protein
LGATSGEGSARLIFIGFAQLIRGRIEPVYAGDVARAAELGLDRIAGIEWIDPANLAQWRDSLSL